MNPLGTGDQQPMADRSLRNGTTPLVLAQEHAYSYGSTNRTEISNLTNQIDNWLRPDEGVALDSVVSSSGPPTISSKDRALQRLKVTRSMRKISTALVVIFLMMSALSWFVISQQFSTASKVAVPQSKGIEGVERSDPKSKQLLTLNTSLKVQRATTLEGDLTVYGTTTLQGIVVKASADVAGNLNVQGNGVFTGTIAASNFISNQLSVRGDSSFTGTISAKSAQIAGGLTVGGKLTSQDIQGVFTGDGKNITNISATNCADCVRLQTGNSIPQIGNISLMGDLTIAGTINSHRALIQPVSNTSDTFVVQDANGSTILGISALDHHITVDALVPVNAGSISVGTYTAAINTPPHDIYTATISSIAGAGSGASGTASVMGPNGFAMIAYDVNSSLSLGFTHCLNNDCTSKNSTIIESGDRPSFTNITIGLDGFARIAYEGSLGLQFVRCQNADCTAHVSTLVDGSSASAGAYGIVIRMGKDGFPRLAYENNLSGWNTYYAACSDADCTTPTITYIDRNQYGNQVVAMDVAADGFARLAYADAIGNFKYARCTDYSCSTPIITVVVSFDGNNYPGGDGQVLRFGSDGLARLYYVDYNGTSYFTRCLDNNCIARNSTTLVADSGYTYIGNDMLVGPGDVPQMVYESNRNAVTGTNKLNLIRCTDPDCAKRAVTTVDSKSYVGDSGIGIFMGNDGFLQVAYGDEGTTGVTYAHLSGIDASYVAPALNVAAIVVPGTLTGGTDIGVATNRFGQLYGQGINLQTASNTAALLVNQVGVITQTSNGSTVINGPIAQFQTDGRTVVEINNRGNLNLGTAVNSAIQAKLNIAADTTGVQALQVTNIDGLSKLNIASDGTLTVGTGSFGICSSCKKIATLSSQNTASYPSNFVVVGDYMYVISASGQAELQVYDVSKPLRTPLLSSSDLKDVATNISTDGRYLYVGVADPYNGFRIYDLKNPVSPLLLSAVNYANGDVFDIKVVGDRLYALSRGVLQSFDITDRTAPLALNTVDLSSYYGDFGNNSLVIKGTVAFVYNSFGSVYSVDISNPAAMSVLQTINNVGSNDIYGGTNVVVSGNYLFVASSISDDLEVYNISDARNITLTKKTNLDFKTIDSGSRGLYISGNTLYVQGINGLRMFNIMNPQSPVLTESYQYETQYGNYPAGNPAGYTTSTMGIIKLFGYIYVLDHLNSKIRVLGDSSQAVITNLNAGASNVLGDVTVGGNVKYADGSSQFSANVVQGNRSVSTDILQLQSASGSVVSSFGSDGALSTPGVTTSSITGVEQSVTNPTGTTTPGLLAKWYNSDGNYKTVGSGVLAYQGTDGPINWPDLTITRPTGVNSTLINAQWTGWIKADFTAPYTFYTQSDDGSRLYIGDQKVVDNWFDQGPTERSGTKYLTGGVWYPITIEFYQGGGGATVSASWSSGSVPKALIPLDHLSSTKPIGQIASTSILSVAADSVIFKSAIKTLTVEDAASTGSLIQLNGAATTNGAIVVSSRNSGNIGLIIQGVSGQTADLLQFRNDSNVVVGRVDVLGGLTVRSATVNGTLTLDGHFVTGNQSGATTAIAGAQAGVGGSCQLIGNDTAGKLTLVTGTNPGIGALCTVSFNTQYSTEPRILLTPYGPASAGLKYYVNTLSNTNFSIGASPAPSASSTYVYFYQITQ
jgi:hypothetical protein